MQKLPRFLTQNRNQCNFGLFWPKFGCHGNCLGSLKISDSIFNFADPENLTIRVKKFSIFCAELKSVHFLFIFGWLKISDSIFKFANPENLTIRVEKFSIFCAELKSVQIFVYFCPNLVAMATPLAP